MVGAILVVNLPVIIPSRRQKYKRFEHSSYTDGNFRKVVGMPGCPFGHSAYVDDRNENVSGAV